MIIEEKIYFSAQDLGKIEGMMHYTESSSQYDAILLVPPHPGFAGTMDNNVIEAFAKYFAKHGYVALRFNYPGIGESDFKINTGESVFDYWDRVEEERDFKAALLCTSEALRYLIKSTSRRYGKVHLIGYSFGALIAFLISSSNENIASVSAVAMPWIKQYDYSAFSEVHIPKLFISGKDDFVLDTLLFEHVFNSIPQPKYCELTEDDHFFRGTEIDTAMRLHKRLIQFVAKDNLL